MPQTLDVAGQVGDGLPLGLSEDVRTLRVKRS
jgi:hypothetical protein